jgi:predicted  nucleic acid-binding Zn-ribbon protein
VKEYLAVAAILISCASLGISIWSALFSRRAKLSELRAAVLGKAAEVSSRLAHIAEMKAAMRLHAEGLKDFEGFKLADNSEADQLYQRANRARQRLSGMPVAKGLEIYEEFFHEFQDLNEHTVRLEQSTQKSHDRYVAIAKLPPGAA